MKRLKPENYEDYSNENHLKDIGGTLDKKFIRVDSEFIAKYFDEISKPDSSYQSYADDLIRECYDPKYRDALGKRDLPLKYFSALLKSSEGHPVYNGENNEVACSRLCNLFGVPTVYNDKVKYKDSSAILSLDFIRPGEELLSMEDIYILKYPDKYVPELREEYDDNQTMPNWITLIEELMDYYLDPDAPNRDEIIKDICGDFCVQMFFKLLVLNDEDFRIQNVAVLVSDDKKSARLAPAYDFEYCRYRSFSVIGFFINAIDYFRTMQNNYPDKMATFMENFRKSSHYKNGEINTARIKKIMSDVYDLEYVVDDNLQNFVENIKRVDFIYDKFKQSELDNIDIQSWQKEYLQKEHSMSK